MKEVFPEFYINRNELDFKRLDDDVLIVFDTNTLLDLYRVSSKLRVELMKSIKMVKDNIWMPYQVGHEFHKNRKELMHEIQIDRNSFMDKLDDDFDKMFEESINNFQEKNKLYEEIVENHQENFEDIKNKFKFATKDIARDIKKEKLVDYIDFLEEIFEGKVESNKGYEYEEWVKEAEERYELSQPPGYMDYKDKKKEFTFINGVRLCKAYGDYFLWKELLLKSKDEKIKEVVFITNDQKEDWIYEAKGRKIGARMELVEEMMRESSANFRIYSTSSFLYHTSNQEDYKSIEKEVIHLNELKKHLNKNSLTLALGREIEKSYSDKNLGKGHRIIKILSNDIARSLKRLIELNHKLDKAILAEWDVEITEMIENEIIDLTESLLSFAKEIEATNKLQNIAGYFTEVKEINRRIDKLERELIFLI